MPECGKIGPGALDRLGIGGEMKNHVQYFLNYILWDFFQALYNTFLGNIATILASNNVFRCDGGDGGSQLRDQHLSPRHVNPKGARPISRRDI